MLVDTQYSSFNRLRHLDIRFNFWPPRENNMFWPDYLRTFLKAAETVEHLVLGFGGIARPPGNDYNDFASVLLESTWPRLRALHLVWISAKLSDIIQFLDRHKPLLRSLTLEDVFVNSYATHDQWLVTSPVMSIVCHIREKLQLETFRIREHIGNPVDIYGVVDWQLFKVWDRGNDSDLLQQIQRFAVRKGDFPFPGHERLFDQTSWPVQYYPEHDVGIERLAWNKDSEEDEFYPILGAGPDIKDVMSPFLDDSWRFCRDDAF